MKNKYSSKNKETTKFLLNASNNLCMAIVFALTIIIFYDSNYEFDYGIRGYIVLTILYISILHTFNNAFGAQEIGNKKILDIALSENFALIITDFIMFFVLSLIEGHIPYVRWPFVLLLIVHLILSIVLAYFNSLYIRERFRPLNALVIYGDSNYKKVVSKLKIYQQYEFSIQKAVSEEKVNYRKIKDLISKYECVICIELSHIDKKKIVKKCYENNIYVYDVPSITDVLIKSSNVTNFIDTPILRLNKFGPNKVERIIKRGMDIFGAILLLIVGSPFMIISAIIIKLQDGGEVLFRQKRLTKDGREFELIKFRSMVMNAEPNGKMIKAKQDDNRITKYGKFMRSTRIDELPQVVNILMGDMSFVGPRALRIEEYKENEKNFPEFRYRLKVQAGLTGYAQLYGKYNTTYRDKLLYDIYYIENYSVLMDIKLILMSFINIFISDSTQGF